MAAGDSVTTEGWVLLVVVLFVFTCRMYGSLINLRRVTQRYTLCSNEILFGIEMHKLIRVIDVASHG